jgi:peptide/nickel transport system substrate-binding protein
MRDDYKTDRRTFLNAGIVGATIPAAGCIGTDETATGENAGTETATGENAGTETATGENAGTSQPSSGGTLTLAQAKSPIEFDPVVANDAPSHLVIDRLFEGLYEYDEGTGHVPVLADGPPEVSRDATRWVVELATGPRFQNGDPVTAEDVRYSFLAPTEERTENATEVSMIDTVAVVDDRTVQFDLKYPYGPFVHTLHRAVVPASVRGELGLARDPTGTQRPVRKDSTSKNRFNKEAPVGSGPFEFVDWREGEFVEIARWDDYWGDDRPNLSRIRFEPVEEATTRAATLSNGESDVIGTVTERIRPGVRGTDGAGITSEPGIGYFYLAFNCAEGPTADPQVREAIDYTFSMDQAVENFVQPAGVRQYSPLPRPVADDWDMPLEEWESIPHDKDVDRAASMLADAGVPKDYPWRIIVPPDDKREQIGVSVGMGLEEAGYSDVTVRRLDWGPFLERYVSGSEDDYNMYTLGWGGPPDPDAFTYYLFGRTADTLGVTNGTFYGANSRRGRQVADDVETARESADRGERQQLYQDAITTLLEDRAHIPSYNLKNSFGVADRVQDFDAHPVSQMHVFSSHNNTSVGE